MNEFAPRLVSWNLTRQCNLQCSHCYLDANARSSDRGELTTAEGMRFIDQLADYCPGAMLVLTGGEPLLRADLDDLISHSVSRGLLPVLGTNGTLLAEARVKKLVDTGLNAVGVSVDSLYSHKHDAFRGMPGAWDKTIAGIDKCREHGIAVQIHTTATAENHGHIPELISFAAERGAIAFHLFFLVCTGRGQEMSDITPAQYETALKQLVLSQDEYQGKMLVRARCAPHFKRLAFANNNDFATQAVGCMAGKSYCRITPEGDITPCPYIPQTLGNLRTEDFTQIWENDIVFRQLRQPSLQGRCGICDFDKVCGGCRARALAATNNLMAEDPWCDYQPDSSKRIFIEESQTSKNNHSPIWTQEAQERLARVPAALRPMIEKGVEAFAQSQNLSTITPELMAEMRQNGATLARRFKSL
ncbi:MAG: radical SAM protein [Chloroflexi bacterium]|nr:radical SAM protein [Chloroflexota bacterium]